MWRDKSEKKEKTGTSLEPKSSSLSTGARFYYRYRKFIKTLQIYLVLAGPGIIVMVADNDAGGSPPIPSPGPLTVSI